MSSRGRGHVAEGAAAQAAVDLSLAAYGRWEPRLHAFAWMDADRARAAASRSDRARHGSDELVGTPVGVKDIFDTAGIPTEFGSELFRGRIPRRTASAVTRLLGAGAFLFGKTVTAEFAYFAPGPTANPWNIDRTPGGSSMGSAAAVAAGIVPVAVGTQTNGSVIRPAAFCGVVGFKPTAGLIPTRGVLRFSPSLDQVGTFARSVADAARAAAIMAGEQLSAWGHDRSTRRPLRLAVVHPPEWDDAELAAREAFDAVLELAHSAGAAVDVLQMPPGLADAVSVHRVLMAAEAHRFIGRLLAGGREGCSPQLRVLLEEGGAITPSLYRDARRRQLALVREFPAWFGRHDALLSLSTYGEAPPIATTGDPRWCTRWTLIGAPAITLPIGLGPNRLPLGIQAVAPAGSDATLLAAARWLEALIPPLPAPPQPAG